MSSKKECSLGIKNFRSHNKSYYGNGSGDSTQKIVLYGGGGSSTKNEQQDQWITPSLSLPMEQTFGRQFGSSGRSMP